MAVAGKKKIFDGKYEILSIVGRGSRSVVYHARNITEDNSEVALKVLIENKKDKISNSEKLRREALAMVSSHHPHVVRLDDFHSVGEICYLSMEFAPESDLRKYTAKLGGTLPVEQAEIFLQQVTEGLEYVHRVGIIHRDIKPDNLLVVDSSSTRIGDFGVALLPGDEASPQDLRNAVGTMDYMAPEVLEGIDYNQRSDIYSLGLSFYEMLTGVHPFAGASLSQQLEVRSNPKIKAPSELRPEIPTYLSEAILKAMAYDPKERFTSAKELLHHLKQKRVQKNPVPQPKKEVKKEERHPPQLKVISGSQGQSAVPEPTPVIEAIEPVEAPSTNITESHPANAQPAETVSAQKDTPSPEPEVPLKAEPEVPLKAEPEVTIEPIIGGDQKSEMDPPKDTMDSTAPQTDQKTPGRDVPLKDSRASRNPTVFIAKDTAAKIRQDSAATPGRAPLTPKHAPRKKLSPQAAPSNNYFVFGAAALGFLLCVLGWNMYMSRSASPVGEVEVQQNASVLPTYQGDELSFPNLPEGVYIGAVTGLIPNTTVSMTAVSLADRRQVALLLGLEGWTPTVLSVNETAPTTVRVISNGMILEFTGQVDKGLIKGSYKNVVSGTKGNFVLKPSA